MFFPIYIWNNHPNWLIYIYICVYIFHRGWTHQPECDGIQVYMTISCNACFPYFIEVGDLESDYGQLQTHCLFVMMLWPGSTPSHLEYCNCNSPWFRHRIHGNLFRIQCLVCCWYVLIHVSGESFAGMKRNASCKNPTGRDFASLQALPSRGGRCIQEAAQE